ncbi:hypothetical protein ACE6H2_011908 [Prunus campanulata]
MMVARMGWWSSMIVGGLEVSGGEVEEVSGGEVERSHEWVVIQFWFRLMSFWFSFGLMSFFSFGLKLNTENGICCNFHIL